MTGPIFSRREPGSYGRINGIWHAVSPNGIIDSLRGYVVTEYSDGTITVTPSIQFEKLLGNGFRSLRWDGYLSRGNWIPMSDIRRE